MIVIENADSTQDFNQLWDKYSQYGKLGLDEISGDKLSWNPDKRTLSFMYEVRNAFFMPVFKDDVFCGYLIAYKSRNVFDITWTSLVVMSMYVLPEFRGGHIFLAMFRKLKELAKREHCSSISLNMPADKMGVEKLTKLLGKPIDFNFQYLI